MNRNGYLPEHNCKRCKKPLSETERYLGIYTGICNRCMNSPAYIRSCYRIDNALVISHPPHAPAWRREREIYKSFIDCNTCFGSGHIYIFRSLAVGGSYYLPCEVCSDRFWEQPDRTSYDMELSHATDQRILPLKRALDAEFRGALPERLSKPAAEFSDGDLNEFHEMAKPFLDLFDSFRNPIVDEIYGRYAFAYEKRTYPPGAMHAPTKGS